MKRRSLETEQLLLIGVLLLAFLLRAALLAVALRHPGRATAPDTQTYLDPALKLLAGGLYPADSAWRTPLYPMFIALSWWVSGKSTAFVILVQVLLGTASVYLAYRLGRRLLSGAAGLIGALLLAVSVEAVTQSFYLLTEGLFTFLLLCALLALVRAQQEAKRGWLVLSAALLGLCALCRPIALYFPLVLAAWLVFGSRRPWRVRLQEAATALVVFAAVLAPWLVRNTLILGAPTFTTISDNNLLFYNAAALEADMRGMGEAQVRPLLEQQVEQRLAALDREDTAVQRARVERELALQILLAHPVRALALNLKEDANNLIPDITSLPEILGLTVGGKGTLSVLNQQGLQAAIRNYFGSATWLLWVLLPLVILLGLIYIFGAIGIAALARGRCWGALAVLLLPAAYFLVLPGASSLPRFRGPVMPYLCLLAGQGLLAAFEFAAARRSGRISRYG